MWKQYLALALGENLLAHANTLPIPKKTFYNTGSWSKLADWETELKPFYRQALKMLGASPNPKLFDGDLALKEMATDMDREKYFEAPDVAVYFGKKGETVEDPYFNGKGAK